MNMTGDVMNGIGNNMIGSLVISFISHTHARARARVSIDTNGNIAWIN